MIHNFFSDECLVILILPLALPVKDLKAYFFIIFALSSGDSFFLCDKQSGKLKISFSDPSRGRSTGSAQDDENKIFNHYQTTIIFYNPMIP